MNATLSFCNHGLRVGSVQGAWLVEQSSVVNFSLRKDVEEVTKGMFSASESGRRREQMRVIHRDGYSEEDCEQHKVLLHSHTI